MSNFSDKISGSVERYIDELVSHYGDDGYKSIFLSLSKKAIIRLFAERFATKTKKLEYNSKDDAENILMFFNAKVKKQKQVKLTKADIVRQLFNEVADDKKDDLQAIIEQAGWLSAEQLETIEE